MSTGMTFFIYLVGRVGLLLISRFFFSFLFNFRYGGTITSQIKRLGASCDWTRERFTLDEQLSRKTVFLSSCAPESSCDH